MATQTVVKAPASPSTPVLEPYIASDTHLPEFPPRALILGTILGMVFGASSLYLVLKVGLTVSASIPVAVISLTLFRVASKFSRFLLPGISVVVALPVVPLVLYVLSKNNLDIGGPQLRLAVALLVYLVVFGVLAFCSKRYFPKRSIKDATILENNIAQTAGSAGESI